MKEIILKRALQEFGIDAKQPVVLTRESADNIVFTLGVRDKKVLRISKRLPVDDIVFECEAVNYLAKNDAPVPRFLPAESGEYYALIDGTVVVLAEFIEGHHVEVDKDHLPTEQHAFEAGRGLAEIHNAGEHFHSSSPRHRTIFSELERALRMERVFAGEFEGGKDFIDHVRAAIRFGKEHYEGIGLIHNDYRPGNVFFDDSKKLSGIIDFDWSCIAPIKKDFALGILEWSFPDGANTADQRVFDSFMEGYNSLAHHKQVRDRQLYQWIAFAALSDAATYFCDLVEDPAAKKRTISSYMYRKHLFFADKQ